MFESIQKELRKPAHYLSMRKREQAADHIDKLEAILNQYSEDEILLTHQDDPNANPYSSPVVGWFDYMETADYILSCNPTAMREVLTHIAAQDAEIAQLREALTDLFGADMEHFLMLDGKDDQIEAIAKARAALTTKDTK